MPQFRSSVLYGVIFNPFEERIHQKECPLREKQMEIRVSCKMQKISLATSDHTSIFDEKTSMEVEPVIPKTQLEITDKFGEFGGKKGSVVHRQFSEILHIGGNIISILYHQSNIVRIFTSTLKFLPRGFLFVCCTFSATLEKLLGRHRKTDPETKMDSTQKPESCIYSQDKFSLEPESKLLREFTFSPNTEFKKEPKKHFHASYRDTEYDAELASDFQVEICIIPLKGNDSDVQNLVSDKENCDSDFDECTASDGWEQDPDSSCIEFESETELGSEESDNGEFESNENFDDESDDDIEIEFVKFDDDQEINERQRTQKKVAFNPDVVAYNVERCKVNVDWNEFLRDSIRVKMAVDPIFDPQHRLRIWTERFSDDKLAKYKTCEEE